MNATENKNVTSAADTLNDIQAVTQNPAPASNPAPKVEPIIVPSIKWTNDELGEFAHQLGKRNAIDVWRLGRAIKYVHERTPHGEWGVWQAKYLPFLSERTIGRYEKVGNLLYDDVKDVNLDQIYRNLFGEDYATPKARKGRAVRADQGETQKTNEGEKKVEKAQPAKTGEEPDPGHTEEELKAVPPEELDKALPDLDDSIGVVLEAVGGGKQFTDDQRAKLRTLYGKLAEMFA